MQHIVTKIANTIRATLRCNTGISNSFCRTSKRSTRT